MSQNNNRPEKAKEEKPVKKVDKKFLDQAIKDKQKTIATNQIVKK